jgi:hypothetical protein
MWDTSALAAVEAQPSHSCSKISSVTFVVLSCSMHVVSGLLASLGHACVQILVEVLDAAGRLLCK